MNEPVQREAPQNDQHAEAEAKRLTNNTAFFTSMTILGIGWTLKAIGDDNDWHYLGHREEAARLTATMDSLKAEKQRKGTDTMSVADGKVTMYSKTIENTAHQRNEYHYGVVHYAPLIIAGVAAAICIIKAKNIALFAANKGILKSDQQTRNVLQEQIQREEQQAKLLDQQSNAALKKKINSYKETPGL